MLCYLLPFIKQHRERCVRIFEYFRPWIGIHHALSVIHGSYLHLSGCLRVVVAAFFFAFVAPSHWFLDIERASCVSVQVSCCSIEKRDGNGRAATICVVFAFHTSTKSVLPPVGWDRPCRYETRGHPPRKRYKFIATKPTHSFGEK